MGQKGGKVIEVPFVVGAGMGCMYLVELFHKWSRDKSLSQLEWGDSILHKASP